MEQNNKPVQHWYLHIDLDAFFASVEQLDNPEFRGKPVIVGGRRDDKRGVVSTCSYEARKYGVHSAMPTFKAVILCPEGIFVRGRMKRYAELSYQIMNIFREFSPDVEQMSIDEAFIDLTGTENLYGPPEETAMKVKKRVKDLTGLTVSVGLATTKYLAKIASGFSKPDGFYFVRPGEEQSFMLKLPLKKVWGIGPKALERLHKAGINTTQDIYDKPYEILEFLLGNSMANFLYNVVRGKENESFNRVTKNHSISAENTYHEDITDIYTAETALLELAHGVMFRLLKEEKFSRTVTVKIKYDDFSTVSIQRTLDRNILTVDSFFDVIKELFEEKYENGRGIRLLGVGFDKVEDSEKPYQLSLFDDKDDKKQAVEKAILDLNKKIPGVKIHKARLLKMIIFGFLFLNIGSNKIYAEENKETILPPSPDLPAIPEEDPSSFYQWDINDKDKVIFDVNGFWKANIEGNLPMSFGKGLDFTFSPSLPVFKQDIELTSMFTLNNKWYFEANFADNFNNNTLTFGYKNPNFVIQSAKLSNRNITMPNVYSSSHFGYSLSGGNNQAPGFSLHFASPNNEKHSGDFLFRYDMTLPKTEIYHGMNKVSTRNISPSSFLYGHSFTFPANAVNELSNINSIYVEDKNGKYKDKKGTSYKKLSNSEYYYNEQENILYFSVSAKSGKKDNKIPSILLTFTNDNYVDNIISKSGSYNDSQSFLGHIQSLFNSNDMTFDLAEYSFVLENYIDGKKALKIQSNEGFSPFIIASTYDLGSNIQGDISIILKTSNTVLNNYYAEIKDNVNIDKYEDFFNKKTTYATVVNKNNEYNQFPFSDTNPEIYLNLPSFSDISLSLTNYSPVNKISISRNASSGTIQVYKNGVYYPDFIYTQNDGSITFLSEISNSDIIKIIYEEEASDYSRGIFSMGGGYTYNILPNLKFDISLTSQYPLILENSYSTIDNLQTSFLALTTGIDFNKGNFKINDKIAFSMQKPNTNGVLLVSTQSDNTKHFYNNDYNSSSLEENDIYIKDLNLTLQTENNSTVPNIKGVEDSRLKGYKLPLSWDFNKSSNAPLWASINIKLNKGSLLKNSSFISLILQLDKEMNEHDVKIFLELGIDASKNIQTNEKTKIVDITNLINFSNTDFQEIVIPLTDIDRSSFVSNSDLRVIVVSNNNEKNSNTIYIGPYAPVVESIFTYGNENLNIQTSCVTSPNNFFSSVITWDKSKETVNKEDGIITASTNFSKASFNNYKEINFTFAYTQKNMDSSENYSPLSIILDSNSESPLIEGQKAFELVIDDISPFITNDLSYHNLKVNLEEKKVSINDIYLPDNKYTLTINNEVVPSRVIYKFDTSKINKGAFYINNITYNKSDVELTIENNITSSYKKSDILKIKNYAVLKNGFIDLSSSQKFNKKNINIISSLTTGITMFNLKLNFDFALNNAVFTTIGHSIETDGSLFNVLNITESYRWNNKESSHIKDNSIFISLSRFNIPLTLSSNFNATNNKNTISQNHISSLNSIFNINNINISFNSNLQTTQNINLQKEGEGLFTPSYFDSYTSLSSFEFSKGSDKATSRTSVLNNTLSLNINNFVSPSIRYSLKGNYENINNATFGDSINLSFSLPFNFGKYYVSFDLDKKSSFISPYVVSGDYFKDMSYLFNIQSDRTGFYTSIPFYELFDKTIKEKINGDYNTSYKLTFKKSLYNSYKDLFIPSTASLAVVRDIVSKEKFSDTYQIKGIIETTSLNNFGKMSKDKIFTFFDSEEITSGLSSLFKIHQDNLSNTEYLINSYLQLVLFFKNNETLNNYFDYQIDNLKNWSTKGSFTYSRKSETSLLTAIISLFKEDFNIDDYKIKRKDSFKYDLGVIDSKFKQQYNYSHSVDVSFLEHFTVITGMEVTFSHIENGAFGLNINYNLGGQVKF